MDYELKEISPVKLEANVTIPANVVDKKFMDEFKKLRKKVNIKGFRKGKVPISYIKKLYGDSVKFDVLENIVNDSLKTIIEEKKIRYVDEPKVKDVSEIEEGKEFKYTVEFFKIEEFEIDGYKDLEIEIEKEEVTDEMFNEALENILKRFTSYEDAIDEQVKEGYQIVAKVEAFDDNGEKIDKLSGEEIVFTIGQNYFLPDFDKYFIGLTKDDETEITHKVNLEGEEKEVNFKIKVLWIKKPIVPELNEEFIKQFGDEYKSVEDFKQKLREQLERELEEKKKRILTDKVLEKLREINKFEYPEILLEKQIKLLKEGYKGPQAPDEEELRKIADTQIRNAIIINKIIEKENIQLETQDIEDKFKKISEMFNLDVENVKKFYYSRPEDYNRMLDDLINDKAINFLLENIKVKEIEPKNEEEDKS